MIDGDINSRTVRCLHTSVLIAGSMLKRSHLHISLREVYPQRALLGLKK